MLGREVRRVAEVDDHVCVELQSGSGLRLRNSMLPGGRGKAFQMSTAPWVSCPARASTQGRLYRDGTIKIFRPGPLWIGPRQISTFFLGQNFCKTMQRLYRRCRQDFHTKDLCRIFRALLTGFRQDFHWILSQRPLQGLGQDALVLRTGETAP